MATTKSKKPATKKAAAKKPTAKKPAVKKAAVKKAAANKPAVKKTAAKKAAVKKAAVKKQAARKPAVKKAAAKKAAVKKPAARKPAVKKAATKKAAVKKPATRKPAVKKAVVIKKPKVKKTVGTAESAAPVLRLMDLFDAYGQNKLPRDHGYIVSAFFSERSVYSIYEIVSYSGVKDIHLTATGLTFVTNGKKLYVLVEPSSYPMKYLEPVSRKEGEKIEKRFSELETVTTKNQTRIMIAKEPNETYGSFTIIKPTGINFARVLYNLDDVYDTLKELFEKSFNKEVGIPQSDAKIAATLITNTVSKQMSFQGEFV